jgi:hypothetical protein
MPLVTSTAQRKCNAESISHVNFFEQSISYFEVKVELLNWRKYNLIPFSIDLVTVPVDLITVKVISRFSASLAIKKLHIQEACISNGHENDSPRAELNYRPRHY